MTDEELIVQFQEIEDEFNRAVLSNSVAEITKCIASESVLVDAQGGILPKERFFYVVEQGMLLHSTMTKEILRVKVYDTIAVVASRGKNTGMWQGEAIEADEWITDIYKKENEKWFCVLTHLTPVKK